jgi:hypothetical protein
MTTTRRLDLQNAMLIGGGLGIAAIGLFMLSRSECAQADIPASQPIGQMVDGAISAGVSPDTGRPLYTTPKDAPLTYTFDKAQAYCARLDAHGHKDWRAPAKAELNELFKNRAVIENFNTPGSPTDWYWSSSRYYINSYFAWGQRFSDGIRSSGYRSHAVALRCVRG